MYNNNNNSREEKYKSRRHSKNKPSFSSTLLDQIYRSIDADDFKPKKEDDEKFTAVKRRPTILFPEDNDFLFFSSTNNSCSSDSSGALSSSDTEFFGRSVSSQLARPKPIRTAGLLENQLQANKLYSCEKDDTIIKFKSRASKIYRKVKQPISPGGRLTSFLNSLFHSTNGNKLLGGGKNLDPASSVTNSFSRSCLSKCPPPLDDKSTTNIGNGRTVRFNPLSVIVDDDEDSRAYGGHKCIYHEISDKFARPPLPLPESKSGFKHRDQGNALSSLRGFHSQSCWKDHKSNSMFTKTCREEEEGIDCDDDSDSSSDLFELDHLSVFGNDRFCDELPVYETTRFGTTKRAS